MEINRNNYEAYFIDYLEGNLDEKLVDSFIDFIKHNPDLKEELELFESVSVTSENISFNKKDSLYKEKYDSEKEFNTAAIAILEGDISIEEKAEFEGYLAEHPELKKEAALFSQTKLKVDESIIFSNKNRLYRKPLGKTILLWSGRVAAVLIIALAIFTLFDKNSNGVVPENKVAEVNNKTPEKEQISVIQTIPSEGKKTGIEKEEKLNPKPEVLRAIPENKATRRNIETSKDNMEDEYIALARVALEVPAEMNAFSASLHVPAPVATLGTMYLQYPENTSTYIDEKLLGDMVKEKAGFGFKKIGKASLRLVANISNERFTYETTNEGKVKEYKYDSRLLAFSIPNKKVQSE